MRFVLIALSILLSLSISDVFAHHSHANTLMARERPAATQRRLLKARSCALKISEYNAVRRTKRGLNKLGGSTSGIFSQYALCVTAPESTEGPYYINNEYMRQDLTEDQPGIKLELDIGVVNTDTCEPLPNVFVELWSCNATGVYGGFTTAPLAASASQLISGPPMTDGFSWLRGGFPTNDHGVVGLKTIYPGFYTGRAIHIHVMVHSNYTVADNGTIISHDGTTNHIGQFYFDESWNDKVLSNAPYTANKQNRTLNVDDHWLPIDDADGNNAFIHLHMVGKKIEDGLLGYITLGVDPTESVPITSPNYYNATEFPE